MIFALLVPLVLQAAAMGVDELHFHRRRGLPRWERVGHPLDTLTVLACLSFAALARCTPRAFGVYLGLAAFSCLFVTKDEAVHAKRCSAGEHWLHAVLFVLHPIAFGAVALLWVRGARAAVAAQAGLALLVGAYQTAYWNLLRRPR